ncbi:MAG: TraB/GumN family protein [Rhizobiaceae bacterium]|nr:TraB/GumN family protein [Rhizobiaceae bacterium]
MKRILAIADRGSLTVLRLLAAANLLFFICFLAFLMMATGQVRAQTPACTGNDLLAALRTDDPSTLAKIEAEGRTTENGAGLLWKIERDGVPPSYLYGTMHVTDPRVTSLSPSARTAYDAAGTVVIETTEVLDQSKMMAVFAERPDLMMFTDGTTLESLLPPDDVKVVNDALSARGIPLESVSRMKPWVISSMIALPACELARKAAGAPVLDVKLAEDARKAGKQIDGLETIADQLGAMASLPMELHVQGLVEMLKLGDRMDDVIETMVVLYLRGDTGMFWPLFRAVLPAGGGDSGYGAFEETMVKARNRTMIANAAPILRRGNAFVAVGALHLPGPEGLIALLRKDGFTVTRAD